MNSVNGLQVCISPKCKEYWEKVPFHELNPGEAKIISIPLSGGNNRKSVVCCRRHDIIKIFPYRVKQLASTSSSNIVSMLVPKKNGNLKEKVIKSVFGRNYSEPLTLQKYANTDMKAFFQQSSLFSDEETQICLQILNQSLEAAKAAALKLSVKNLNNEVTILQKIHANGRIKNIQAPVIPLMKNGDGKALSYLMKRYERDLFDLIQSGSLSITKKIKIVVDLARALSLMHEKNIVHRDIKTENCLVCLGEVDWTDFGCAIDYSVEKIVERSAKGTYLREEDIQKFCEAETLDEQKKVAKAMDIFAFGVLIYNLLTRLEPPLEKSGRGGFMGGIQCLRLFSEPIEEPEFERIRSAFSFLETMWSLEISLRPNAEECAQFFNRLSESLQVEASEKNLTLDDSALSSTSVGSTLSVGVKRDYPFADVTSSEPAYKQQRPE